MDTKPKDNTAIYFRWKSEGGVFDQATCKHIENNILVRLHREGANDSTDMIIRFDEIEWYEV